MKEAKIDAFMAKLHSRTEVDTSIVKEDLNLFLTQEFKDVVNYMNNALFINEMNVLVFLRSSINQGAKIDDDLRKLIYEFLSEYIAQNTENLTEYIAQIFKILNGFFNFQHAARPKQFALLPLITIIDCFDTKTLTSEKVIDPDQFHLNFVNRLKEQKFVPGVKGYIWLLISTIQGKFTTSIDIERKREVQKICLHDLKTFVNDNKNFSTIAALLKSFSKSLEEIFLSEDQMELLYKLVSVLILPLTSRYEVSISALKLLSKRTTVFHKYILDHGEKLFEDLCGLLNHKNRNFVLQLNETLDDVLKEIVKGIQENPDKYEPLYQEVIKKSWSMLQDPANYQIIGTESQKEKYKYNIVTILKMLGTISPLVRQFQTSQELQKFFNIILIKCSKKIKKAFSRTENYANEDGNEIDNQDEGFYNRQKMHIKFILYNQKELVSFISALSQIIYNINSMTEWEESELIKIIMIAIEQYPSFFENYVPSLARVLVEMFKVLQIKSCTSFYHVFKKIISSSFRILLDSKRFNINSDDEYYSMIRKAIRLWLDLINNQNWSGSSLLTFGNITFEFLETMIEHLDISYKSNLQIEIQENAESFEEEKFQNDPNRKNEKEEKEDIAKTFFLSSETMRMSNIEEFRFMHSLVLVLEGILSNLKNFSYTPRIIEFYVKMVERIRVFPKSVSLMKTIRALNNYLVKTVSTSKVDSSLIHKEGGKQSSIEASQLNEYCQIAKKLYIETTEHYLQKHQEECLYECLKMLTSFPVEVYFFQNCELLKTKFSDIIKKCFEMGQEIITLANTAIDCMRRLFEVNRAVAQKYLIDVIPKMERFIWLSGQGEERHEIQSSKKIYLFVDQMKVSKELISKKIMDFLGSIGGLSHLLVQNSSSNLVTWDFQYPLEIDVLMGNVKCSLDLSKILNRICFLALNGEFNIKKASCEFLHSIFTVIIGNAAEYKSSKEMTANFVDKIFPTILEIASNSSHPSQQLIHTILIQSIRFFALTQEPNSPDISVILKHLLLLYKGTEDMSCLGSKCIAQLVRWHIKSDVRKKSEQKNYPIIKVIMRNIRSLASNKKTKDGLILLLVELLREIHREENLMKHYALQICSIIINIGRSNQPIEKEFNYLIQKLVLSLNKVIKKLIIEDKREGDQYEKFPTIHKFLESIYENNFFSIYSQQREIAFILWKEIISKYSQILNYTCLDFLRNKADRNRIFLFAKIQKPLEKFQDKELFPKLLSKLVAFSDIWKKLLEFNLNSAENLARFKDIEEIVIQSYINFTNFLMFEFNGLSKEQKYLNEETQRNLILAVKSFPSLLFEFKKKNKSTGLWLQQRLFYLLINVKGQQRTLLRNYMIFMLKIIIKPSKIVPNFDYDLIEDHVYLKAQTSIKDKLSLSNQTDVFTAENCSETSFSELILDYLFNLSLNKENDLDLLDLLFNVIQKLYFCNEEKLIGFLFDRNDQIQEENYGFSSSFIESYQNSKNSFYIYERQAKTIIKAIQIVSKYYLPNEPKIIKIIGQLIGLLKNKGAEIAKQKKETMVLAILGFSSYSIVRQYFFDVLLQNDGDYIKFDKHFNRFLLLNFSLFAENIFDLLKEQPKLLKIFYFLKAKLPQENIHLLNKLWMTKIPSVLIVDSKTQNDCYRLNYLFVQSLPDIQNEKEYLNHLSSLIKEGLNTKRTSEIHFLTINLASIILKRLKLALKQSLYLNHQIKTTFDRSFTQISNFYIPYTLAELKKEDEILNAQKYLKVVQKMIYLSDDFKYCIHLFIGFRDKNLSGKLRNLHDSIIDSVVSKYYNSKQPDEQLCFAEWILSFFENEEYNNRLNPWDNFRLTIIERFFVKIIHFTNKQVLIQLFHKYAPILTAMISEKMYPKNVEEMMTEFQIKQGAFIIINHLYMYLPKPEKDKSQEKIHTLEHHKKIIAKIVQVLKNRWNDSSMNLMKEYDKTSKKDKQSLQVFRNYMCSAYNCLIVIFISTQSKVDHFKKYLFEKGEVLWEHLVDPNKTDFQFPIETEFELMKPIEALSKFQFKNERQLIRKKVRDEYMQSSLYAIDEQAIAQSFKQPEQSDILLQNNNQHHEIKGSIEQVLNIQIEEDFINRHPSMISLLRVIDYMYQEFFDGSTPTWMKPIYDELIQDDLPLSIRIFLTKLIVNRPEIFAQASMWGQCLIKYLCLRDNGGKFIHYFYRDALLLLLKFIKNGYKPKTQDINYVVMKLVRCLPHDKNMNIYSSNVDILQEFMKLVPEIYIDRAVIMRMLTSTSFKPKKQNGTEKDKDKEAEKEAEKNKFQWRACACIVMKSCLMFKVPILNDEEWKMGMGNNQNERFSFFVDCVQQRILKVVEDLIYQTTKRYKVAAAGLLGEMLRFFNQKDPYYVIKEEDRFALMVTVKQLVNSVYSREENRSTKQRLSLLFSLLVSRYPMILSDSKMFGILDTVVVKYKQDERFKLLEAALLYLTELLSREEKTYGYSVDFMQTIRSSIKRLVSDSFEVYQITIKVMKQYTKPFFLENKEIFIAILSIYDTLQKNYASSENEKICIDFYQFTFALKDFINSLSDQALKLKPYLLEDSLLQISKTKIKDSLIAGLGNQFNMVRKIILEHFEQSSDERQSFDARFIQLMKQIYSQKHENLWIINSIPLIFSKAKKSSNYNTFLFNKQIEQSAQFYDVDFKNINFHSSSQPYTPISSFFTNNLEKSKKISESPEQSFIASIGSNRMGGMIRATQNSYMSQEQQVFTMLASQSEIEPSMGSQVSESQMMDLQIEPQIKEEERNYTNLNNIFMNARKKNPIKEVKPSIKQNVKFDSNVNVVGDKIRFKPKQKQGEASQIFRLKKISQKINQPSQNTHKIHSSYRSYKVGEMPNVQISVAHVLQPLVQVCCFDKEVSSELFTIFLSEIISKSKDLETNITDWFVDLLKNSTVCDFSFISTLQKCLITICEQGNSTIKLNINEIAIKSNTIDYAIVFTEQNLIKHGKIKSEKQKSNILIEDEETQNFVKSQWADLIDLYQKISGHAFLPPMLKHITKTGEYEKLLKTLELKQNGVIAESYSQLEDLMKNTENSRLSQFLEKQKIDCLALLGEWQPVSDSIQMKSSKKEISDEEKRLLTLSLLNSQKASKQEIIRSIKFPVEKFDYQKALIELMKGNTDLAEYHAGKELDNFYKFFKKTTSFDYNSKHLLLQNIQKVYEMREFISIYRNKEPYAVDILNVMNKWVKRLPNQMFDSNLTWIQLLESRIFYTKILDDRFMIPKQKTAKANTDYMIQVINQMLQKNIYGCAEVITKKALVEMKNSGVFNWNFYEALSDLKLLEYKKKGIINPKSYELVPKIILKELTDNKKSDFYSDIKYLSIQNDHMEGFLESCAKAMMCEIKPNVQDISERINKTYINYDKIKRSFKNLLKQNSFQNQIDQLELEKIEYKIHFSFSLFLEKILQLTKGRCQIKELGDLMEKSNLPLERLNESFVSELIESISLMNLSGSRAKQNNFIDGKAKYQSNSTTFNYKEKEINEHKLFSMILKLLKTIQSEKKRVGKIFSDAINERKLPVWIFVYFIPQIIKTLNSYEMVEYFTDLFDQILKMYPEALVYHFNCYYQKQNECITEAAKQVYEELHKKLDVHFKFIEALELLYHPEKRLKQILEGFARPGEDQNTLAELDDFINIQHKRLGKYNKKFIEQHKPYIRKVINLKKQKRSENLANTEIEKLIRILDPKNKDGHQMRDFSKISDGSLFFQDYNSNDWNRIEVPATIYCKFEEPLSWNKIFIESFDLSILTLKSQRKPKRITLYGSNEKKYMFLVKGGEDVRLDQRIEEMFNIMNKVLRNDTECAKKKLEIKRFEVIPIKKMLGIFEWIDDTQTLKEVLQKELKKTHENYNLADMNPAFKEYMQKVRNSARGGLRDNVQLYKQFLSLPEEQIVSNMNNCQSYLPFGLLRKTLLRLSKSYDFYLHIKNQFLSNYAVACIVGYILGIGDRHLQNFLIHASSASVILIDFGYSFGSSRDLAVPEMIPFRLTKCIMELMEPIGYEGIFKEAMVNAFSAFQDNKNVLIDFCDVFIDDPLMEWIWKCKKENPSVSVSMAPEHISMTISQDPPERKIYSKRIEYVEKKLVGQHPRKILVQELQESKHKQSKFFDEFKKAIWKGSKTDIPRRKGNLPANEIVEELITLASDKNILGRSYIGLNPFV